MKYTGLDRRILCIPDLHAPYHDDGALNLVFSVMEKSKPDIIVVMGDWFDCWQLSFHEKNQLGRFDFADELAIGMNLLKTLEAKQKYFIEGNHEHRLNRYLSSKAPELSKLISTTGGDIKGLVTRLGFEFVPYRSVKRIGKIYYTHDFDRAGRYAVHQGASDIQHSFVIGHTHRLDFAVEGDPVGSMKLAASFGWLGDFETIDYRNRLKALREWAHGFGFGYMAKDGTTFYQPVPIVDNKCVVEGRLFTRG